MIADLWQHPAVIGLIIAIPSATLGLLGYLRSRRVDKVAEQAGIATSQSTSIGHVVDGLNKVITALQNDNKVLRERVEALELEVRAMNAILKLKDT